MHTQYTSMYLHQPQSAPQVLHAHTIHLYVPAPASISPTGSSCTHNTPLCTCTSLNQPHRFLMHTQYTSMYLHQPQSAPQVLHAHTIHLYVPAPASISPTGSSCTHNTPLCTCTSLNQPHRFLMHTQYTSMYLHQPQSAPQVPHAHTIHLYVPAPASISPTGSSCTHNTPLHAYLHQPQSAQPRF